MEGLTRLLRKQPDGSDKVVGEEKHVIETVGIGEEYQTYVRRQRQVDEKGDKGHWFTPSFLTGIPHDRRDKYTGITIGEGDDAVKVFERDLTEETFINATGDEITVVYKVYFCGLHLQWRLKGINHPAYESPLAGSRPLTNITGIEGVK